MTRSVKEWNPKNDDTPAPARVKDRILQLQNDCCACCGLPFGPKRKPEFDHIIAIILGGENSEVNIQALCGDCHGTKSQADVGAKSKLADIRKKRFDLNEPKGRGFYRPPGVEWNWRTCRYERASARKQHRG